MLLEQRRVGACDGYFFRRVKHHLADVARVPLPTVHLAMRGGGGGRKQGGRKMAAAAAVLCFILTHDTLSQADRNGVPYTALYRAY